MLRDGLRAMVHERLEDARDYLRAIATEEALGSGDLIAIDSLAFLSSVTWSLGDPISAVGMAERALELAPERFATNQKAGEMSMRLGHLDKAEARFLAALRASEPGTSDARSAEACLREARKRTARGIAHGTRGIGLGGLLRRLRRPRPSEQTDGATAQPAA
jgi:tetratricopeptide (TPR) repeat protein